MAETIADLIDRLVITHCKLWHVQESVYRYQKMSEEDYAKLDPAETHRAWKRLADLNLTRTQLIGEIDEQVGEAIRTGKAPEQARVKIT